MATTKLTLWVLSVVVAFAAGYCIAWQILASSKQAETSPHIPGDNMSKLGNRPVAAGPYPDARGNSWVPREQALVTARLDKSMSVDELLFRATLLIDQQEPNFEAEDRLRKLAQSDPAVARRLMQRFESEREQTTRDMLKSVLGTVQDAEVLAFAKRLANSTNASQRKDGFDLLQHYSVDTAEIRQIVSRTLENESDPSVLVRALAALGPTAVEVSESDAIVKQLRNLALHSDAAVRSQSIYQLGRWDKKGDGAELLPQALNDQSPQVRHNALFALARSGDQSDGVKVVLMNMIGNAKESREIRGSALQVLEGFVLSKEEFANFAHARKQLQTGS